MENQAIFEKILEELKKIRTINYRSYEMIRDINAKMIDKVNELDLSDAFEQFKKLKDNEGGSFEELTEQLKKGIKNGKFKL